MFHQKAAPEEDQMVVPGDKGFQQQAAPDEVNLQCHTKRNHYHFQMISSFQVEPCCLANETLLSFDVGKILWTTHNQSLCNKMSNTFITFTWRMGVFEKTRQVTHALAVLVGVVVVYVHVLLTGQQLANSG